MANIKIADLQPAGCELFQDSESFLNELTDGEVSQIKGGSSLKFQLFLWIWNHLLIPSRGGLTGNTLQTIYSNNVLRINSIYGDGVNTVNGQSINALSISNANTIGI